MAPKSIHLAWASMGLFLMAGCDSASVGGSVGSSPFVQQEGLLSVEAEHYHRKAKPGSTAWKAAAIEGASGESAMQALPDEGARFDTKYAGTAARLDYRVEVTTTGEHYVWVRGWAPDEAGATVHVGIDGEETDTADRMSGFSVGQWTWSKSTLDGEPATLDVSGGVSHVINVWMREDGFAIDKIVVTTDADYVPSDTGPPESPQKGQPATARDAGTTEDAAVDAPAGCGDGVVSGDEECDGQPCCTADCKIASEGTVCRPQDGECDVADECDGVSAECPADEAAPDGTSCGEGMTCSGGTCGMLPTTTIEAEEMDLEVYVVDPNDGTVIRIPDGQTTGTATATFDGPDGEYSVRTLIKAENDGQSSLQMEVNDTPVYDETYPLGAEGMEDAELPAHMVTLSTGDTIVLTGTQNEGAWARVDKLVIEAP